MSWIYTQNQKIYTLVIQNYYAQYNKEEFKNKVHPLALLFFLALLCSLWDLTSQARDWTCALGSESVESQLTKPPQNSPFIVFICSDSLPVFVYEYN